MARMPIELLLLLVGVIVSAAAAEVAEAAELPLLVSAATAEEAEAAELAAAAEEAEAAELPLFRVTYPVKALATVFSHLGFQKLSAATAASNLSLDSPITVFAPPDDSPNSNLFEEYSVPGLHPFDYLRRTSNFYTELETLAPRRCLRIGFNYQIHDSKLFVGDVEISQPDLFNNGLIIVHGLIRGGISPLHCRDFIPQLPRPLSMPYIMPLMLTDAIIRLQNTGYGMLALALRMTAPQLSEFTSVTVFGIHDYGDLDETYTSNFEFHVIPNKRFLSHELASLPVGTLIPTMDEHGHKLVVTNSSSQEGFSEINYVRISSFELLQNSRVVVHDISTPFIRIDMDCNGLCYAPSTERKEKVDSTRRAFMNQVVPAIPGVPRWKI